MKKLVAVLLCLVMVLSLMACGAKQGEDVVEPEGGEEPMTGMPNPWMDYASLKEINEQAPEKDMMLSISGVYGADGKSAFEEPSDEELQIVTVDNTKLARWMNIDGQYVLMVEDNGEMAEEDFQSIAQEMMNLTNMDMANANGENG